MEKIEVIKKMTARELAAEQKQHIIFYSQYLSPLVKFVCGSIRGIVAPSAQNADIDSIVYVEAKVNGKTIHLLMAPGYRIIRHI